MQTVIVLLRGGLGNQLFQYAAGLMLSDSIDGDLCLHSSDVIPDLRVWWRRFRTAIRQNWASTQQRVALRLGDRSPSILGMQSGARLLTAGEARRWGLSNRAVRRLLRGERVTTGSVRLVDSTAKLQHAALRDGNIGGDGVTILSGYFQDESIVEAVIGRVRETVSLPLATPHISRWRAWIERGTTVGVHVRRGDYLVGAHATEYASLTPDWYARSAAHLESRIRADLRYLVVSDDPQWARDMIRLPGPTEYVVHESPVEPAEDLRLLSLCQHHIIANSTFSWWGARLGETGGVVVAPSRWRKAGLEDGNLYPARWMTVEVATEA
ncbi:MAG: alpha-1,2-fucosyltransferase [Planctomycetota bacterium]|nr:alpha-1,2-fucosyltransferase [Planctomycetota bacterium]